MGLGFDLDHSPPGRAAVESAASHSAGAHSNSPHAIKMTSAQNTSSLLNMDTEYDTLCQLSYAPATQTTVVTTTTTTTTSFPPFAVKGPRNLNERDPKQYPLAATPTPSAIKRFFFNINGTPACFQEAEDSEVALQDYSEQHAKLAASNGSMSTTFTSDIQYESSLSSGAQKTPVRSNATDISRMGSTSNSRKRPAPDSTPISVVRAAEVANAVRKSKRVYSRSFGSQPKSEFADLSPVTPATDNKEIKEERKPKVKRARITPSASDLHEPRMPYVRAPSGAHLRETIRQGSPLARSFDTSSTETEGPPSPPSFATTPGTAATPPVGDGDFDPISSFTESVSSNLRPETVLPPLDTTSIQLQDPSLPSPLLSPVTAAASPAGDNFGSSNGSSAITHVEAADYMSAMSGYVTPPTLPASSPMDLANMIDSFDSLPSQMQTWFMYQLLRRSSKTTLQFVADVVNPALKCDFLARLPRELSMNIIRFLDVRSLCRAAQVSRKWRAIVDSDEKAWKDLLDEDGFVIPKGEVERARREGWEWQGLRNYEKDLSTVLRTPERRSRGDPQTPTNSSSRPMKRKSSSKSASSSKRRKLKQSKKFRQGDSIVTWEEGFEDSRVVDPIALTATIPELGMESLRHPHLYKSIYRRHHGIRKSWMENGAEPYHLAFRAHGRHVVTCLQFDGDKILTGSDDTRIHVYNTNTGALDVSLDGHEGGVWALQYDGNTLVSGSTDRTVRVWDIEKGRCLHVFQGHTSTVRCLVILQPTVVGHKADGTPIMMPKEPLIITGSRDSTLRIWKLPKVGDSPVYQAHSDEPNPYFVRQLNGHIHSVRAIAAHGDTLVSGSYDSTVRVWKISNGEVVHRLAGHGSKVYSVILDHARHRCISGSMDNLVKVWSLDTGACIFNLEGHTSLVGLLDLGHQRLVSAAADSTLRIWDPETGQCKSTLSAHTGAITCFQHDSQKVISGSDRTLKMWNVKTGECVRDLLTDLSGVWQVKFNERKCVAAVQRNNWTYIEVLDFGASRDGIPEKQRKFRWVVDEYGEVVDDPTDDEDLDDTL